MNTLFFVVVFLACAGAFLFGLYMLALRSGQRKRGLFLMAAATIAFAGFSIFGANQRATAAGWQSAAEQSAAKAAGVNDPEEWRARIAAQADAAAEQKEIESAENRQKGFHCLSPWDGTHKQTIELLAKNLREPDSFEHIETRITPVDAQGYHLLTMTYRARNGFGGMNVETVSAQINSETCAAILLPGN